MGFGWPSRVCAPISRCGVLRGGVAWDGETMGVDLGWKGLERVLTQGVNRGSINQIERFGQIESWRES